MSFSHELHLVFQAYCDGLQEKGPGAVVRTRSRLRTGPLVLNSQKHSVYSGFGVDRVNVLEY
jgi:hypothetical protein